MLHNTLIYNKYLDLSPDRSPKYCQNKKSMFYGFPEETNEGFHNLS